MSELPAMALDTLPPKVPRTRQELSTGQRWRLDYALRQLDQYERAVGHSRAYLASLVLEFGIAATARELGVSHEAIRQRVAAVRDEAEQYLARRQANAAVRRRAKRLTPDERAELLAAQGGHCALCPETIHLHLDHDHETGEARAILCASCNKKIGFLETDLQYTPSTSQFAHGVFVSPTEWRSAALAYLAQHPSALNRERGQ